MSILPDDVRKKIEHEFKNKKSRAAAFELLIWKTWPTPSQREEIGKRNDVTSKTVLKVLRTIQEMELFTEAEGSIPMYGDSMRKELNLSMEPREEVERKEEKEEEEPREETAELAEDLVGIRNKVFRLEAEVGTIRKNMETIVPIIKGLSASAKGNPSTVEKQPTQNVSIEALEVLLTAYQIYVVRNGREDRFTEAVKTAMKVGEA